MTKIKFEEHSDVVEETEEEEFERLMKASGFTPGKPTTRFKHEMDRFVETCPDGQTSAQIHIKGY